MSVLPILTWPDPRLSQRCAPVRSLGEPMVETTPETTALITDLFDTMYAASGRGLAAPQVGVLLRIFVMDCGWKTATQPQRSVSILKFCRPQK